VSRSEAPVGDFAPDQPPEAVQDVALLTVQNRVVPWPANERLLGVAEKVMTGGGGVGVGDGEVPDSNAPMSGAAPL
jgi:hypothetical protein